MAQTKRQTATELIQIAGHPVLVSRKPIKNLILKVQPDGSLSLSLPRSCSMEAAERFIRSKEAWITKMTARQHETARRKAAAEAKLYREGDQLFVLGKPCILHWQVKGEKGLGEKNIACSPDMPENPAKQENKNPKTSPYELCFSLPSACSPSLPEDAAKREKRVWSFYKEVLEQQIIRLLPVWKRRLNIERETHLHFQKMKSRWGSCQTQSGRLCFNTRLAEYPTELIEYVLVHELTHLDEPSHNKVFYALMDQRLPGWKKYRKALRFKAEELYRQTSAIEP